MTSYRIALLPGDGIGPECMADDPTCINAAITVERAVAKVLSDGHVRTPDIGGNATTTEVAQAVADALSAASKKV